LNEEAAVSAIEINDHSDVLDNINFISSSSADDEIIIDVTAIKDTKYVEYDGNNVYIRDNEMIKLLLLEVKKLKEEIRQLKVDSN
jgi:hypothetical protein